MNERRETWQKKILVITLTAGVVLSACGTSSRLQELGDRFGCGETRETGKVDMKGTGTAAFCDPLPEGKTGLIFAFESQDARDHFFTEIWPNTEFAGSFVLVGPDWGLAVDTTTVEEAADLQDRVGGVPLRQVGGM